MVSMILLLRVHLFTIETITTDTCIQEMHPSITGVAEGSYPTPEQISYYIYKFANRYANKGEVDHLNESIRGRDQMNLKNAMASFVSDRPTLDKKWCCPPAQDPMMVQPFYNEQS